LLSGISLLGLVALLATLYIQLAGGS